MRIPKPLSGIRVLDLTNVLAGPFCCHQLAHMGAEVIKIEAVGRGDLARQLGADSELSARKMGISFLAQNAGKKSVTLNLKHSEGVVLFRKLVAKTDVVVENFRPGVMDKLGLSYSELKKINSELIYCAISGFGQDGPLEKRPAYDQIIQGYSGIMSITGEPDGKPLRVGYPIADTGGGLTAAMAVSAALNAKPRGLFIDISMLEATLATMGWAVSNYLIGGVIPAAHGNENTTSAPSGTFQTQDGLLNISANRDEQWEQLARHLGREDLLDKPEFATREDRKRNRYALKAQLEEVLASKSAGVWEEELNQIGVPAGAVLTVGQALSHPQVKDRGMIASFENVPGVGRDIKVLRTGMKFDGKALEVDRPPPELGANNDEVLAGIGVSGNAIDKLREDGVI